MVSLTGGRLGSASLGGVQGQPRAWSATTSFRFLTGCSPESRGWVMGCCSRWNWHAPILSLEDKVRVLHGGSAICCRGQEVSRPSRHSEQVRAGGEQAIKTFRAGGEQAIPTFRAGGERAIKTFRASHKPLTSWVHPLPVVYASQRAGACSRTMVGTPPQGGGGGPHRHPKSIGICNSSLRASRSQRGGREVQRRASRARSACPQKKGVL